MKDTGLGDSLDVVCRKGKEGFWEDRSYGSIFVQEKAFVVLDIDSQNLLLQFYISIASSSTTEISNNNNSNKKQNLWLYWDHQCKVNLLHDP